MDPAALSPAHKVAQDSSTGDSPNGIPRRCVTRHGGGVVPEEHGTGESVGQELGGALHHRRRLGKDVVPVDAVWGRRHGGGGGGGMEVEITWATSSIIAVVWGRTRSRSTRCGAGDTGHKIAAGWR
ncbi:hypothetical protein D1007_49920 [Hordeum vulgare]|nr:hypothetical protein D1007_49920 [Hordeum vulgare]